MSFSTHSPGSYQQSPDPSGTYLPQYVQSLADQHSYTGHEKVTSTSHGLRPLPTDHSITPQVASQAIQKLVSNELRDVGFDSAQPSALRNLELEVAAFIELIYERARGYANLAHRAGPIATDLLLASKECDLEINELQKFGVKSSRKRKRESEGKFEATLLPPASRSPSPELLHSDDEDAMPVMPVTLRALPDCFPPLPPKHTYLRTPASPPKKAALPSLEKKLKTAGLVQESLKNLLLATEENFGHEDGELLGHIVNWEASTHPRKRWKVGV